MTSSLLPILPAVDDVLFDFAQSDGFWANLVTAFGTSYDVVKATQLRQQWQSRNFSQLPPIEILSPQVLGTANGAYSSSTNKIYLSASFLNTASPAAIVNVILEEIGHYVDAQINQVDSAGDEGAIFAELVSGESLSSQQLQVLKLENDTAIVEIDGQQIQIEQSSLTTTDLTSVTATDLVTALVGPGVTVGSISFTGANVAAGLFSGGLAAGLGINEGIVLSSGNIALATGPNNSNFAGADNFQLGDTDLNNIVTPNTTNDAAVLQFNFIPLSSTISFAFVFASEEYPEFVGSAFNDVFAFFVNGENIALIPGTTTPVSINNVSPVTNSAFFISNDGGTFDNQFDGFTTVLSATADKLAPGIPAKIKLAIADTSDDVYDSAVFIQAGSFGNPTIVTVTAPDPNAGEGTTVNPGTFTISRTGSTASPLTVIYSISGTASSSDYNALPTSITIPVGQAATTITVTPTDDTVTEGNETVILSLTDTVSYDLGTPNSATIVIADNEVQSVNVTLSVSPASVLEDGTQNLVYTFNRTGSTASPLTVNFTVGGGAAFSTDYTQTGANTFSGTTGTVIFAANSSTATVTIDPTADATVEPNETVALTLASGTGYTVGTATAVTGTIIDDDQSITLGVNPSSVTEDGTANLVYTFTRIGVTTNALTVNYTVGGTATFSTDYTQTGAASFTATSGTVNFLAGSSTATVTFDPTADTTVESNETVILTLATGTGYTVGTTTAVTGTINNDDTNVTLAVAPGSVTEDGTTNLIYTFTRTGVTSNPLTVNYTLGGTATLNTDYTRTGTTNTVTFAAGSSTATVTVDPTADTTVESNETVILTLATGTGYTVGTPNAATGTINNDDTNVTLAVAPGSVTEDGTTNLIYTFTRSGSTTNPLTVNYTLGGTATLNTDYTRTGTTNTVTFAAGSSTATVTVDPTADTTVESNETVILTLATGTGYTVGTTTAVTGTITNDDVTLPSITLTVSPSPSSVTEDGTTSLTYIFTRTGSTTNPLTVNYTVGGTATLNTDYTRTGTTNTVTFAAGSSTATVTVDPTADTTVESDETVILTLAAGTGYTVGTTTAVTGTITNDDFPQLSINDITVVEGQNSNAILTVTVNNPNSQAISVNYTTTPINAIANVDYTSQTGTLTIAANTSTATISIPILNDNLNEPDEAFTVTLSNPVNATINPDEAIGQVIITDTLQSAITRTLPTNVENLRLIGTNNINGTGNAGDNKITGNSGNNILAGANGNDIYCFNASTPLGSDTIQETTTGGIDTLDFTGTNTAVRVNLGVTTVQTAVTNNLKLTFSANNTIENIIGDSGNDRLTGNSLNNTLTGGGGNDQLTGQNGNDSLIGGFGDDLLTGGNGSDNFIFNSSNLGIDAISDFTPGSDKIVLSKAIFTALQSVIGNGFSQLAEFASVDDDDLVATSSAFIVYSTSSGSIYYNQNGSAAGLGSGSEFANLLTVPTLIAADFALIN